MYTPIKRSKGGSLLLLFSYGLYLLTKYGAPEPWSAEKVRAHIDAIKVELRNKLIHSYTKNRRVWAQKPL